MNILIIGSNGFIGRNLYSKLMSIKEESNILNIEKIIPFTRDNNLQNLENYIEQCDVIIHSMGICKEDKSHKLSDNTIFTQALLSLLEKQDKHPILIYLSSIQAKLEKDLLNNIYGKEKLNCENLIIDWAKENSGKAIILRLPGVFGKWSRPNYNSVVATFCYNSLRGIPLKINNESSPLNLIYIDTALEEILKSISEAFLINNSEYVLREVSSNFNLTVGELAKKVIHMAEGIKTYTVPSLVEGSFDKALFTTLISFLPDDQRSLKLKSLKDSRGSFTELLRTENSGQFSLNIVKPLESKGSHWHHNKIEAFFPIMGKGFLICKKPDGSIVKEEMNSNSPALNWILPGEIHSLLNASKENNFIVGIWAYECYDRNHPDVFKIDWINE